MVHSSELRCTWTDNSSVYLITHPVHPAKKQLSETPNLRTKRGKFTFGTKVLSQSFGPYYRIFKIFKYNSGSHFRFPLSELENKLFSRTIQMWKRFWKLSSSVSSVLFEMEGKQTHPKNFCMFQTVSILTDHWWYQIETKYLSTFDSCFQYLIFRVYFILICLMPIVSQKYCLKMNTK